MNPKKPWILTSLVLILAGLIFSCKKENNQPSYIEYRNIRYGILQQQDCDIILPLKRNNKTKTIILIHGGGWVGGDKADFYSLAKMFADKGFAASSVNYRYASNTNNVHYQEMIDDIGSAIDFISSKSGEYGIDGNNFGILGHSAGAHLALLYTYKNSLNNKVRAVVSISGAADLLDPGLLNVPGMYATLLQLVGDTSQIKFEDASPIRFVNQNPVATLLVHGKSDDIIPFYQSVSLFNALTLSGIRSELILMENHGHNFTVEDYNDIIDSMITFYNSQL